MNIGKYMLDKVIPDEHILRRGRKGCLAARRRN
jgi:hypothetical protein